MSTPSREPLRWYGFRFAPASLANYARELALPSTSEALDILARTIRAAPGSGIRGAAGAVVGGVPRLALLAGDDAETEAALRAQLAGVESACLRLRWVGYRDADRVAAGLSLRLRRRLGAELARLRLTAIPRGGWLVAGLVARHLPPSEPVPPEDADRALLVIDDCAFTGTALRRFLRRVPGRRVVFAPLFAPPELASRIEQAEPQVEAVVAGEALRDRGVELLGAGYSAWRRRWRSRLPDRLHPVVLTDFVCFPWNEPSRLVWNRSAGRAEAGWRLMPGEVGETGAGGGETAWRADRPGPRSLAGRAAEPRPVRASARLMEGYRVYGVGLRADRRFRIPLCRDPDAAELTLRRRAGEVAEPRAATLAYASPRRTPAGDAVATLHREGDVERLSFAAGASFWLRDDEIEYRAHTSEGEELLEVLFLGAVMAYWLERRGCLALHASAVEAPGERAVAFLAAHGAGKTSLAAAFLAAGDRLLTDDLLAVDLAPAGARARAGSPGVRMAPALAASFGADVGLLERVHPRIEKRLVPVGTVSGGTGFGGLGFGVFQPRSLPLASIYLPQRGGSAGVVRIARVSGVEALKELIRCSWSPYIVEAMGLQPDRLERLGRLVEVTPVRRLEYPAGLDRLAEVREAVVADLSA